MGALEMHPVFVTIGNIQSDVRMQATSYTWCCVAFIPTPEFEIHSDFQSLLSTRLFHHCQDIMFASLKEAAEWGAQMTDALGYICRCFTLLVGYIADLPEQQMVACVAKNASPVTTATISEFGDSFPHPPQSGVETLQKINDICTQGVHPWDVAMFQAKAKAIKLSGVHLPFWHNWKFANPMYFLIGELLHSGHKFIFNHVLKWCKEAARKHVLDAHYKTQHKYVGVRHFGSGISHVNQMTGREHCDIQQTLVPMLVKASPTVSPLFVYCIQLIIKFIYRAQSPIHTDATISLMVDALSEFHGTKQAIIQAEARHGMTGVKKNFNIPKLKLFQSFAWNIWDNGTLMQYTADVTEHLHITHCKIPFEQTNWNLNTFIDQIVRLLNCEENIQHFNLYHILCSSDVPLEMAIAAENEAVVGIDPTLSFLSCIAPKNKILFSGPCPFRNHFSNPCGFISADGAVAFHVMVQPDFSGWTVAMMEHTYNLLNLVNYISNYIFSVSGDGAMPLWDPLRGRVSMWNKFHIQQHSSFRSRFIMKSQVVQAYPRSSEHPWGVHDTVIVYRGPGTFSMYSSSWIGPSNCSENYRHRKSEGGLYAKGLVLLITPIIPHWLSPLVHRVLYSCFQPFRWLRGCWAI